LAEIYLHAWVSGRVQGVWFRQSTREKAEELNLRGWVRNLNDGRVEVMAAGEALAVRQLEAWLGQGPTLANVVDVCSEFPAEIAEQFDSFEVR